MNPCVLRFDPVGPETNGVYAGRVHHRSLTVSVGYGSIANQKKSSYALLSIADGVDGVLRRARGQPLQGARQIKLLAL